MKIALVTDGLFLVGTAPLFANDAKKDSSAAARAKNHEICTKEYKNEPVERYVCDKAGAALPHVRDCLIHERATSGNRDKNDTLKAEVERHASCFAKELKK